MSSRTSDSASGELMTLTYPFIEALEAEAGRRVEMESRLTERSLAICDLQQQSRLFTLPPELRNAIFDAAIRPDDIDTEYDHHGDRPEAHHHAGDAWCVNPSTALSRTCRRAWLEANHLSFTYAERIFKIRGSSYWNSSTVQTLTTSGQAELQRLRRLIDSVPLLQHRNLAHLHIMASSMWLERELKEHLPLILGHLSASPRVLTISIRENDWTYPAQMPGLPWSSNWLKQLLEYPAPPSLREIRVELGADHDRKHGRLFHLARIVTSIRQDFAVQERPDCFGGRTRLTFLDEARRPRLREWLNTSSAESMTGLNGPTWYQGYRLGHTQVATLVWKVESISKAAVLEAFVPKLPSDVEPEIRIAGRSTLLKFSSMSNAQDFYDGLYA